ncbi:hypothetical protein BDV98DRAFT_598696 [Pterulicium gracile]|uniref:Uncharacterized protein n=1 Tax=Pterulicium gracile TaxID=1884261 RepID=A0A5C3Q073_9AGAR|nr:hypothetical protein BDV98DRAFT_598696 [Pterula gracilis]
MSSGMPQVCPELQELHLFTEIAHPLYVLPWVELRDLVLSRLTSKSSGHVMVVNSITPNDDLEKAKRGTSHIKMITVEGLNIILAGAVKQATHVTDEVFKDMQDTGREALMELIEADRAGFFQLRL